MARDMRSRLIERYPEVMATGNVGHKPNDALFHAEINALLRAAEPYGGSLAGRTIEMRVDRVLCRSCQSVLPSLGTEIGNPTVRGFISVRRQCVRGDAIHSYILRIETYTASLFGTGPVIPPDGRRIDEMRGDPIPLAHPTGGVPLDPV